MSEFIEDTLFSVDLIEQTETETLLDRQKINKLIGEIALGSIDSVKKRQFETQQEVITDFEARPYQIDAWLKLQEARQSGKDRGLINLATGLGKTTVATFDYAMFRKERLAEGKTAKGLFVVHQNNILDQAGKSFQNLMPDLNIKRYQSNKTDPLNADFILATFQSLKVGIENSTIDENEFGYIVYDEAHHIEAETYKQVVEHLKPVFQLGLTATPKRMDEKDITDHFGEALYTKTLPEAIVDGYLATVDYNLMIDDAVQQMIDENFNPETISEINGLFDHEPRNEEIVKNILIEQEKIKSTEGTENVKTIIFCADKEHADNIAELMNGASYHSGVKEQDNILKSFKDSSINTITAVDMINEGVDIPDTRMIVFLRTTQSQNVFEQQLGRGLRKTADKDKVTVLDFVANIDRAAQINELKNEISEIAKRNNISIEINKPIADNQFINNTNFLFDKKVTNLLEKYYKLLEVNNNIIDFYSLSNEELVLLWHEIMPGQIPSIRQINRLSKEDKFLSAKTVESRFNGSTINFQIACGYENNSLLLKSDKDLVCLWLELMPGIMPTRQLINELSKENAFLSYTGIKTRFEGSLVNFQIACGYKGKITNNAMIQKTNEELIDLWHELMPGEIPTHRLIRELSLDGRFLCSRAIEYRFGNSIINFQKACDYEIKEINNNLATKTNEELVDLWHELMPGEMPTASLIDKLSKEDKFLSYPSIRSRFGDSLIIFQNACCYKINSLSTKTNEELVNLWHELMPDKMPTHRLVKELSKDNKFLGARAIISRFNGNLVNFQKACGYKKQE